MEKMCGSLLHELKIIWDEVGETDSEKDIMLLELEQECLDVYRRKVDQANNSRVQLRQAIADAEAELAAICSAMGELPVRINQLDQSTRSLKAELGAILPEIEEMRKKKIDRKNQLIELKNEIQSIKNEFYSPGGYSLNDTEEHVKDLSLRYLEELQRELQALQKEKCERLKHVMEHLSYLYSCCSVLSLDFKQTASEIHPSLGDSEGSNNISNDTIEKLGTAIQRVRDVKIQRMQQLQDLASSLFELWNLMDTPVEEQQIFQKVTCNIVASEDEMTEPDMLSADLINSVKTEVSRLEELKASKMKELVLKKKLELEDLCRKTHLTPGSDSSIDISSITIEAVENGAVDASFVLEQIEVQISKVKEEALSRKDILEKVEKWMAACDEERWLEEYNRDENRYNAGRGTHLTLKRAEKARALVNKLPAMVDKLSSKITSWENDRGVHFTYNGVRLLSILEDYVVLREEKELERKRHREQKKLLKEQETLLGSKSSPMRNQSAKKGPSLSGGGAASSKTLSVGGPVLETPTKATPNTRNAKKSERLNQDRDDEVAALCTGRRGLDSADLPSTQNPPNSQSTQEIESPMTRRPFSPICFPDSSVSNGTNTMEDLDKNNEMFQKNLNLTSNNNTMSCDTPSKMISVAEMENRTPQATTDVFHVPSTPSTVSIPMQMDSTPAQNHSVPINATAAPTQTALKFAPANNNENKLVDDEIEYSFEERRAGFAVPRSRHLTNVTQAV